MHTGCCLSSPGHRNCRGAGQSRRLHTGRHDWRPLHCDSHHGSGGRPGWKGRSCYCCSRTRSCCSRSRSRTRSCGSNGGLGSLGSLGSLDSTPLLASAPLCFARCGRCACADQLRWRHPSRQRRHRRPLPVTHARDALRPHSFLADRPRAEHPRRSNKCRVPQHSVVRGSPCLSGEVFSHIEQKEKLHTCASMFFGCPHFLHSQICTHAQFLTLFVGGVVSYNKRRPQHGTPQPKPLGKPRDAWSSHTCISRASSRL